MGPGLIEIAVDRLLPSPGPGVAFSGLDERGDRTIVVLRHSRTVAVGEAYRVEGDTHPWIDRRGRRHRRVIAPDATRIRTSGALLLPWLRATPGLGETRARRLLARWGAELPRVLLDGARMLEIAAVLDPRRPVLGAKLAGFIQAGFIGRREDERGGLAEADFRVELERAGVADPAVARQLWRLLGTVDAWERLVRRPYAAAALLPWAVVDGLAARLADLADTNLDHDRADRLAGACDSVVREMLSAGDTAIRPADLLARLASRGVPGPLAVEAGVSAGRLVRSRDMFRAPGAAHLEASLVSHLSRLRSCGGQGLDVRAAWPAAVRRAERGTGLRLTGQQRGALQGLLDQSVSLLQGGAGVGKTAVTRVLAAAWSECGGEVVLVALSGKAAHRLSSAAGRPAFTIARLLHSLSARKAMPTGRLAVGPSSAAGPMPPDSDVGQSCEHRPPDTLTARTMVVVDEASMVDLCSLCSLVQRLPSGGRLVLVGDSGQLPPVGLGQCYHDLVAARQGVSELTEVVRQSSANPIVAVASAVRRGVMPDLPRFTGPAEGVQAAECDLGEVVAEATRVITSVKVV